VYQLPLNLNPPYVELKEVSIIGSNVTLTLIFHNTLPIEIPLSEGYFYFPEIGKNFSIKLYKISMPNSLTEINVSVPFTKEFLNRESISVSGVIGGSVNNIKFYISFFQIKNINFVIKSLLYNFTFNGSVGIFYIHIISPLDGVLLYIDKAYVNENNRSLVVASATPSGQDFRKYLNISIHEGDNYLKIIVNLPYNPNNYKELIKGYYYTAGLGFVILYKLNQETFQIEFNLIYKFSY
jgi:hypothetical protein